MATAGRARGAAAGRTGPEDGQSGRGWGRMQEYGSLIRHEGNRQLFEAVEMSIIAQLWGEPLHLHAEGVRGTGKTTILRAARRILPRIQRIRGCPYNCDPRAPHCPLHAHWDPERIAAHGTEWIPMPFREISPSAKVGTVIGSLDLARLTDGQRPEAALLPGTLAQAHRGIVLVDEINRLADVAPELADCLLDVMGTKPGRLQIEETGLPPVEIPVRVAVWAASNPDEEPGPLEEIRRQLSDRFDLVLDVRRPGEPWLVKRILLLGEARARAAAEAAVPLPAPAADGPSAGAASGCPTGAPPPGPGGARPGDQRSPGAGLARPAGVTATAAALGDGGDPAGGPAVAEAAGAGAGDDRPAGRAGATGAAPAPGGDGRTDRVAAADARALPGPHGRPGGVPAEDAGPADGRGGPLEKPPATETRSGDGADGWDRRWWEAARRRPQFPEALLELLAEVYVQFRLESLRALEAWRHAAALYAARAGRRRVRREDLLEVAPAVLRHRVEAGALGEVLEFLSRDGSGGAGAPGADDAVGAPATGEPATWPTGAAGWGAVPGGGAVTSAGAAGVPGPGHAAAQPAARSAAGCSGEPAGPDGGTAGVWGRLRDMLARAARPAAGGPGRATPGCTGSAAGPAGGGTRGEGSAPPGPVGPGGAGSALVGPGPAGTASPATAEAGAGPWRPGADGTPMGTDPLRPGAGTARPGARPGTTPPRRARPLLELTRDRALRSWGPQ